MSIKKLSEINALDLKSAAKIYENEYGFKLVSVRPKSKKAFPDEWQNNPRKSEFWEENPNCNIGVLLNQSRICTLDIDNKPRFLEVIDKVLSKLHLSDNVNKPFWESDTAGIKSGKENSGKLVFRVPENIEIPYHKLVWKISKPEDPSKTENICIFEIRASKGQDILPPSTHPTGTPYMWVGGAEILEAPEDLILFAKNWDLYLEDMLKLNPEYDELYDKKQKEKISCSTFIQEKINKSGKWKFLRDWIDAQNLETMLEQYGYKKKGVGRFLSPSSNSGSAGIQIYNNKFYSFGESDYFADGHLHDAFDLYSHFEFNDDNTKAINSIKRQNTDVIATSREDIAIHIEKPYFDGSKFLCEDLARDMIKKYDKKIAFIDGLLYVKNDSGIYEMDDNLIKKIISEFQTNLTDGQKGEVIKALSTTHDIHVTQTTFSQPHLIPLKSSVYDLVNGESINYNDDMIFNYKIPFDYDANAKPTELVDKILNDLASGDKQRRMLLEEILGYSFYHSNNLARGKAIILLGKNNCGKSTFEKLCRIVLTGNLNPSKIATALTLDKFTNTGNKAEYYTAEIVNSWLNLGDDISSSFLKNTAAIKPLISGEAITGRSCGSAKIIEFIPKCKFVFSANERPPMKDEGGGMSSRLIFVKFNNQFVDKAYAAAHPENTLPIKDTSIIDRLIEDENSLAYLMKLAVEGVQRIYENDGFTIPDQEKEESKNFEAECDTVTSWVNECIGETYDNIRMKLTGTDIEYHSLTSVRQWYEMYKDYCISGNLPFDTLRVFSSSIREKYNLDSANKRYQPLDVKTGARYGKSQLGKCFTPIKTLSN